MQSEYFSFILRASTGVFYKLQAEHTLFAYVSFTRMLNHLRTEIRKSYFELENILHDIQFTADKLGFYECSNFVAELMVHHVYIAFTILPNIIDSCKSMLFLVLSKHN